MASSPQSYTDPADEGNKKQEQITFRFCSECSNMLYPKEDEQNLKLQFTCRTCQYTEEATSSCIFRNELDTTVHETAGVTQDVSSDPTVGFSPEPVFCLLCGSPVTCLVCGSPVDPNLPEAHQHNAYSIDLTDACSSADSVSTSPFDSLATVLDGSFMDDEFDVDSDIFFNMGELPDEQPCDYDGDLSMADPPANFQYHQLPRSKRKCKECGAQEAVYFQSQRRDANTGMTLFYVCCDCGAISK